MVDRLLSEPQYGERWRCTGWMSFATPTPPDTTATTRTSPYRDYVIGAFNRNLPFDQFTAVQLAGDLLPDASLEQRIASGYNRLLQTTEEGGAQPKEYTAKYAADRVRNTSVIWLAGTMGCCECHNHKFDPYTQKDFYSFAAFFADVSETAVGRQAQTKIPTAEQEKRIAAIELELAALKKQLETQTPELDAAFAKWEATAKEELAKNVSAWLPVKPESQSPQGLEAGNKGRLSVISAGANRLEFSPVLSRQKNSPASARADGRSFAQGLSRGNGAFSLTGQGSGGVSSVAIKPVSRGSGGLLAADLPHHLRHW
jgi:hypothetical protein